MAQFQPDSLNPSTIADADEGHSLKVNPDGSINVVGGGSGSIGAVKIEDGVSTDKASVKDISSYFGQPPGTTYGLYIGGAVIVLNPIDIQSLPQVDFSPNIGYHDGVPVVPKTYSIAGTATTLDNYVSFLEINGFMPAGTHGVRFLIGIKNTHSTNALVYKVSAYISDFIFVGEIIIEERNLNPGQVAIVEVNTPYGLILVQGKNKLAGLNSQITAEIVGVSL